MRPTTGAGLALPQVNPDSTPPAGMVYRVWASLGSLLKAPASVYSATSVSLNFALSVPNSGALSDITKHLASGAKGKRILTRHSLPSLFKRFWGSTQPRRKRLEPKTAAETSAREVPLSAVQRHKRQKLKAERKPALRRSGGSSGAMHKSSC